MALSQTVLLLSRLMLTVVGQSDAACNVTFRFPSIGSGLPSVVDGVVEARGSVSWPKDQKDQFLWVFTGSPGGALWTPQPAPNGIGPIRFLNGDWKVTVEFGSSGDSGKPFTLRAIVVDRTTNLDLVEKVASARRAGNNGVALQEIRAVCDRRLEVTRK